MKTLILDCCGDDALENTLIENMTQYLKNAGHFVDVANFCRDSIAIVSVIPKEIMTTSDPIAVDPIAVDPIVVDLPATPETTVGIGVNDIAQTFVQIPPSPPTAFNGSCVILSLTNGYVAAATFAEQPFSVLTAENVSRVGDHVVFTYAGIEFTYPALVSSNIKIADFINVNPEYSETDIRVAVQFIGDDAAYPVMLRVCTKSTDENCTIIFGQDLAELVAQIDK